MRLATTARELVHKHGGATEYSRKTGTPLSNAKKYSNGSSQMPAYLPPMIDLALMAGFKPTWRNVKFKD